MIDAGRLLLKVNSKFVSSTTRPTFTCKAHVPSHAQRLDFGAQYGLKGEMNMIVTLTDPSSMLSVSTNDPHKNRCEQTARSEQTTAQSQFEAVKASVRVQGAGHADGRLNCLSLARFSSHRSDRMNSLTRQSGSRQSGLSGTSSTKKEALRNLAAHAWIMDTSPAVLGRWQKDRTTRPRDAVDDRLWLDLSDACTCTQSFGALAKRCIIPRAD